MNFEVLLYICSIYTSKLLEPSVRLVGRSTECVLEGGLFHLEGRRELHFPAPLFHSFVLEEKAATFQGLTLLKQLSRKPWS